MNNRMGLFSPFADRMMHRPRPQQGQAMQPPMLNGRPLHQNPAMGQMMGQMMGLPAQARPQQARSPMDAIIAQLMGKR